MTVSCPTCGEGFKNNQGVRSHHSQTHGGPGIKVEKVVVDCDYCGNDIKKYPSVADESEQHFCDKECHRNWQSECRPTEEHNWYKGGPITVDCSNCGSELERKRCIVKRNKNHYCSTECEANWKSENQGAYRWDNDKTHYSKNYYGSNWKRQREKRLEVDGYQCAVCGMDNEEHKLRQGRSLSVHHIQGIDDFRDPETNYLDATEANKMSNLITMCRPCHKKWERVPLIPDSRAKNRALSDLTSAGALAVDELKGGIDE